MAHGEGERPTLKWTIVPQRVTEGAVEKVRARVRYVRSEDIVNKTIVFSIGGAREIEARTDANGFAGLDEALQPSEISSDLRVEAMVRAGHGNAIALEHVVAKPTTTAPEEPKGTPMRATLSLVSTTPTTPTTTATTFKVAVQVVDQNGKGVKAALLCRGVSKINGPTDKAGYVEFDILIEKETTVSFAIKSTEVVTNSLTLAPIQPPKPTPIEPAPWTPAPAPAGTALSIRVRHWFSERWNRLWQ